VLRLYRCAIVANIHQFAEDNSQGIAHGVNLLLVGYFFLGLQVLVSAKSPWEASDLCCSC